MPPRKPAKPSAGRPKGPGTPPTLGAALAELIRIKGVASTGESTQLAKDWRAAAGDRIADRTRVVGVRHGMLHVGVQNSALLGELASFHKDRLLGEMQRRLPESRLRGLKFKLNGELRKPPAERPNPTRSPDPATGPAAGSGTRFQPRDRPGLRPGFGDLPGSLGDR
ncbi:DUF721 domain-containing protein [Alienimonas chondri]|uniref:DUF721 domain-containing protein n=1 Tax=Alienimonas chondri TaxID=2681879 RepID=A0ABX1VFF8_9PLAN|nr:DUF721 domain-containing protein [Alienimonas chondri]NNJ26830.1 hypothetical protein [Alienimonas chondri]